MPQVYLDSSNSTRSTLGVLTIVDFEIKLMHHPTQTPVHVVLAMLVRPDANPAGRELKKFHPDLIRARTFIRDTQEPFIGERNHLYMSDNMKHVFTRAVQLAEEPGSKDPKVRTDQLLRAIIEEQDPDVEALFKELRINQWMLNAALKNTSGSES
jgi:ATP-dependent Clp protease ATP-binding subunit ClpA